MTDQRKGSIKDPLNVICTKDHLDLITMVNMITTLRASPVERPPG